METSPLIKKNLVGTFKGKKSSHAVLPNNESSKYLKEYTVSRPIKHVTSHQNFNKNIKKPQVIKLEKLDKEE